MRNSKEYLDKNLADYYSPTNQCSNPKWCSCCLFLGVA